MDRTGIPLYLYDDEAEPHVRQILERAEGVEITPYRLHSEEEGTNGAEDALVGQIDLSGTEHLVVSGNCGTIRRVLLLAKRYGVSLGILPLPGQTRLAKMFALPADPDARLKRVLTPAEKRIDLLTCNGTPVLSDVRIGDTALLKRYEYEMEREGMWRRLLGRFRSGPKRPPLRHRIFTLRTEKEETITLSAMGLIGLNRDNHSWVAGALRKKLSATDGQLALIALAPTSLFELFVAYPLRLLWRRWRHDASWPRSWGYLKSSRIEVESPQPQEVVIDDAIREQTPVRLEVEPAALAVSVGDDFWAEQSTPKSTRNAIRLDGIPRDPESTEYLSRGLPLFAHASQEAYTTLFSTLREEARITPSYITLLILSTVIATLGLFINSGSVIIGAMLLAPLMQPIVSLSMGVLRQDTNLILNGAKAIAFGVGLVLASAMVIAQLTPMHEMGSEMSARLSPTILDMLVAIASGVAAAYAKNNTKISGSLVGVSIAVALVPPLAVSGIGTGWGSWSIFSNAMLLFLTNLVGIVFAAALTFFVQGFSPIRVARRGMVIGLITAVVIAIPLYHSFDRIRTDAEIRRTLSRLHFELHGKEFTLSRIEYSAHAPRPQVRCEVIVRGAIDAGARAYIKERIEKVVGQPIDVIATFRYRL